MVSTGESVRGAPTAGTSTATSRSMLSDRRRISCQTRIASSRWTTPQGFVLLRWFVNAVSWCERTTRSTIAPIVGTPGPIARSARLIQGGSTPIDRTIPAATTGTGTGIVIETVIEITTTAIVTGTVIEVVTATGTATGTVTATATGTGRIGTEGTIAIDRIGTTDQLREGRTLGILTIA